MRPDVEESDLDLGATLEFMRLLWALDHALQRTSKFMDRNLGVTGPQRLVIRILGSSPGISAGRIAQVLKIHPSTLTGILRRLEARRLVRRTAHESDARRAVLRLDPLGERLNSAKVGTVEHGVGRALEKLPRPDVETARRVLASVIAELEADLPKDEPVRSKSPPVSKK
jgi:DNA-binding MarR family transcriptional regulator